MRRVSTLVARRSRHGAASHAVVAVIVFAAAYLATNYTQGFSARQLQRQKGGRTAFVLRTVKVREQGLGRNPAVLADLSGPSLASFVAAAVALGRWCEPRGDGRITSPKSSGLERDMEPSRSRATEPPRNLPYAAGAQRGGAPADRQPLHPPFGGHLAHRR